MEAVFLISALFLIGFGLLVIYKNSKKRSLKSSNKYSVLLSCQENEKSFLLAFELFAYKKSQISTILEASELLKEFEYEIKEVITFYNYSGYETPRIVAGSEKRFMVEKRQETSQNE